MTPEAQRIKIAEACPTAIRRISRYSKLTDSQIVTWDVYNGGQEWLPCRDNDPLRDLNAMHEAEKVLTETQIVVFRNTLGLLCGGVREDDGGTFVSHSEAIHATAAQRAEALLRTLRLWPH